MPNCFQLQSKESGEVVKLTAVDEAICAHLNIEVHPTKWVNSWYDTVGLRLACGRTFEEIRTEWVKYTTEPDGTEYDLFYENMVRIIDFLSTNYTTDSWYEGK